MFIMKKNSIIRRALLVALFAVLISGTAIASESAIPWTVNGALRTYWVPAPVGTQATIRSTVHIAEDAKPAENAIVHLAGLGSLPTGLPDQLSLVWSINESSWWAAWHLQVVTKSGAYDLGPTVSPAPGHTYETTLSCDQASGALSVRMIDATNGTLVSKGGFQIPTNTETIYAGVGLELPDSTSSSQAITLESFTVIPSYVPVAYEWELRSLKPDGQELPVWLFDTNDQLVISLSAPPQKPQGQFIFLLEHNGIWQELGRSIAQTEARIVVPVANLPIGASHVHIKYVENNTTLLSDSQEIQIGALEVAAGPIAYDRGDGQIKGTITLHSAGAMDVELLLQAAIAEMAWSGKDGKYLQTPQAAPVLWSQPMHIAPGETVLPVAIPVPPKQGVWRVDYQVSVNPEPHLTTSGLSQYVATYAPAQIEPGEPYTIAIIPDTQLYTQDFPEVFMRETEWLAEHAEELNLGMVLHVGDITQSNTPDQWQHAVNAIRLLDGVAPYVLIVGSGHDFSNPRYSSLFNKFFTIDNAKKNSNLAGVFKEGHLEDSYALFTLGGDKYLVIAFSSGPSDEAVAWANELATRYPDHKVIVLSHMIMAKQGTFMNDTDLSQWPPSAYAFSKAPGESVNTGQELWDKLLSQHPNMFMSVSGHVPVSAVARRLDKGVYGNTVYSLLADYQHLSHGGDGWIVLMTFNPDDTVDVRTYSTYLNTYKQDYDSYGFNCRFTIDLKNNRYLPAQTSALLDNLH